jgi:hypothetical protein
MKPVVENIGKKLKMLVQKMISMDRTPKHKVANEITSNKKLMHGAGSNQKCKVKIYTMG